MLGLFLVFISWSLVRLLGRLAREVPSQGDLLAGGLAGYLLLGIHGGLLLTVIDSLVPGSFRDPATGALVQLPPLGSALAATSVGYGDIAPTEPLARLASVALSVLGPFYIAVVIAVVVSRYLQAPQPPQL